MKRELKEALKCREKLRRRRIKVQFLEIVDHCALQAQWFTISQNPNLNPPPPKYNLKSVIRTLKNKQQHKSPIGCMKFSQTLRDKLCNSLIFDQTLKPTKLTQIKHQPRCKHHIQIRDLLQIKDRFPKLDFFITRMRSYKISNCMPISSNKVNIHKTPFEKMIDAESKTI